MDDPTVGEPARPAGSGKVGPPASGRTATSLLTAGVVVLVLILVVVLVVIKATSAGPPSSGEAPTPAPTSITTPLTHIPTAVYNRVGINAPGIAVTPPTIIRADAPIRFVAANGRFLPGVLAIAAEYCPYCAAERWAEVAALSRFGTFSGLQSSESAVGQAFGQTPTISFRSASFHSPYVALRAVETAGVDWQPLSHPTAAERTIMARDDLARYGGGGLSSTLNGKILPFLDIAGRGVVVGGSFSPAILSGSTRDQIASGLTNPSQPTTRAIIATANYLTAVLCAATHGQPADVCQSSGVLVAAAALHLPS